MKDYLVFGRKKYQDPLAFLTTVEQNGVEEIRKKILEAVGTDGWIELITIPEEAIEHVVREGKIV
jgi:hypothetical protein